MSFISLKLLISAILFVLSSGILCARKFRDNPVLMTLAGLVALVGSVFLFIEVDKIITGQDDGGQPPPPSVAKLSIQERSAERVEGDSGTTEFTFIATRRGNLTGTTSVRYAVFGGAVDADDFGGRMPSGEIIIRDGQEQGLVEIPVSGDRDEEPDEYFTVRLSNPIPDNTVIVAQTARGIIRNDDGPAPQTSSPPRDDKGAPVTRSSETANAPSRNGSRLVYDAISLEDIEDPEKSEVPFPSGYFRSRLAKELGTDSTTISHIRVELAFIEPYESRRQAAGGTIIGYILVSLPSLANCTRKFGPQAYSFADATTGIMKAINDYISEIADWIRRASLGEKLTCPTD